MSNLTENDVLLLAEKAGINFQTNEGIGGRRNVSTYGSQPIGKISKLLTLAIEAEREACMKAVRVALDLHSDPVEAIRARGQQ